MALGSIVPVPSGFVPSKRTAIRAAATPTPGNLSVAWWRSWR